MFDELAEKLKIDSLEFRIKNALVEGVQTVCGQTFESGVGIKKCLEALQSDWQTECKNAKEHTINQNQVI